MKTIGEVIRNARLRKKYSRRDLEKETKIKKEFIKALEKEEWEVLPEFPVLSGFVKNIASVLTIKERWAIALLKRDYPPKLLTLSPKPDLSKKFFWSPKASFLVGVAILFLMILTYLALQYKNFVSPPKLMLDSPYEEQVVRETFLSVSGMTNPEATVKVNNQPVLVGKDGAFVTEIEVFEGTSQVVVVATSRSGKETVVRRKIKPELEK